MMPSSPQSRPADTLSSKEVCELVGITYRQLDYWVRAGYIIGQSRPGSGAWRAWTPAQVERVRQIKSTIEEARELLARAGLVDMLPHILGGQR